MEKKLYDLMQWGRIEGVVYAEEDKPYELLGAHKIKDGMLVQAYFPDACQVFVVDGADAVEMDCADEAGFFAALLPKRK